LLGVTLARAFADQLAMPKAYAESVTWLRAQRGYAQAVGLRLILRDALLHLPDAPAKSTMGAIYGPVPGSLISGSEMVLTSLIG